MKFNALELVTKISVSDMDRSLLYYTGIFGFEIDDAYTINIGNNYGEDSYVQLRLPVNLGGAIVLGLFRDIDRPINPKPQVGTVPSFIVDDLERTLTYLRSKKVKIDNDLEDPIITNTSDQGYEDRFFFFCDPDNNSFVMRENMNR